MILSPHVNALTIMFNKGAVEIVVPQDTGRQFFISCTSEKGFGDKFVDIFCIYVSLFLICITALSSATWLEPLLHLEQNFDVFVSLCCTANCFFFHINTQWGDWPPELDEERINYLSQMVQESEVQLVCLNPQTQLPMGKENLLHTVKDGISNEDCLPIESEESGTHPRHSLDKEAGLPCCRVCQCAEPDTRGDNVLSLLGITPPLQEASKSYGEAQPNRKEVLKDVENNFSLRKNIGREAGLAEFISPDGEVFICSTDLEMGPGHHQDTLVELGCSCKNDLALVHYACALKWFVNHGSTVCEICGHVAKNIRTADFKKVVGSLKEFGSLRERTASGEPIPALVPTNQGADPDAVASIRRLQLIEISMWFNPHNNNNYNNSAAVSQVVSEQPLNTVSEDVVPDENPATKWAVEGTGILLATGLLTVTLAWLIAPRVGKKTARSGLHILLGGICALTVVVFFRFFVLTRIKYGPARYWAILFVFWFLVFGIWASRTHGAHAT